MRSFIRTLLGMLILISMFTPQADASDPPKGFYQGLSSEILKPGEKVSFIDVSQYVEKSVKINQRNLLPYSDCWVINPVGVKNTYIIEQVQKNAYEARYYELEKNAILHPPDLGRVDYGSINRFTIREVTNSAKYVKTKMFDNFGSMNKLISHSKPTGQVVKC